MQVRQKWSSTWRIMIVTNETWDIIKTCNFPHEYPRVLPTRCSKKSQTSAGFPHSHLRLTTESTLPTTRILTQYGTYRTVFLSAPLHRSLLSGSKWTDRRKRRRLRVRHLGELNFLAFHVEIVTDQLRNNKKIHPFLGCWHLRRSSIHNSRAAPSPSLDSTLDMALLQRHHVCRNVDGSRGLHLSYRIA